ncbi:MAG TPA: hypothetical protein VMU47_04300 [Caldimonas sp.]|nr:hypothetical protein [Caldimonas sp.]
MTTRGVCHDVVVPLADAATTVFDHRHLALGVSMAGHLVVLLVLLWPAPSPKHRAAAGGIDVRLLHDGERLHLRANAAAEDASATTHEGPSGKFSLSKCDGRLYTGIGIRFWANGEIIEVAAGGPADRAGLQAGDTLLDPYAIQPDELRPGTRIRLRFLRGEREMPPVAAVVDRICEEQPRPSSRQRRLSV